MNGFIDFLAGLICFGAVAGAAFIALRLLLVLHHGTGYVSDHLRSRRTHMPPPVMPSGNPRQERLAQARQNLEEALAYLRDAPMTDEEERERSIKAAEAKFRRDVAQILGITGQARRELPGGPTHA